MHIDDWLHDTPSRRRFFKQCGVTFMAGGGAAFLAACGASPNGNDMNGISTGVAAPEGNPNDVQILNSALGLEHMAVAAYTAGLTVLTSPAAISLAKTFLAQEQEHRDGLITAIKQFKGTPVQARSNYGFPTLSSDADVVGFAVGLENTAVAAYLDAIPKFTDPDLRATGAAIMANEAEHISLLNAAVGKAPFPSAFVMGGSSAASGGGDAGDTP